MPQNRYDAASLRAFAQACLEKSGQRAEHAAATADVLVEADLLGHDTHGLQLLSPYLKSVQSGGMTLHGDVEVVRDSGNTFAWDGRYLSGPWLVLKAIEEAVARVRTHGSVAATVCRTHHIGCLQAYLQRVTDRGLVILLMTSDPMDVLVSPPGGKVPLYTPNPIGFGAPTRDGAILIDVTLSTVTNGMTMRLHKQGKRFPGHWLKDGDGNPTDDPAVRFQQPPGSLMPVGGEELGHKGFALGVIVEVLTSALGGHGRHERPTAWGGNIYLQIIDPEVFGGRETFLRETSFFSDVCRASSVRAGADPVRMPGDRALARRAEQLKTGVVLFAGIEEMLAGWADKLGVPMPSPVK